ncbi:MAG: helix-turn-helix domain-containing protein [Bacteroidetes bacterium]|jgi:hypothetical protein|nr:helix-turn-helix domain-containing protein [Bacteroidota bacterium]MBT5531348.1 helix-turn-helix domain-containing protein [Cytophagia bacterium]MBT3935562.1 helix-turn-helix domain-containing protein [Bacteroidota bacterium]MBT4339558.1 helix-turn-helix domain-containing protein [Bacteroidota bacterium]MBT4728664.1 helix-turn-helix domain-containing protein [Bacteroidota bacterium]
MVKDHQIVELLKSGNSYSDIQSRLGVSPSRIAQVKKDYPNYFKDSSENSSSRRNTASSQKKLNSANLDDLATFLQNSSSDPKVLLQMKEIELEHQRNLKQMEYDEKERERDYERELHERELEKGRLQNEQNQEKQFLKAQLEGAKQKLQEIEESQYPDEVDVEEIDPDFESDFIDFVTDILSWDGDTWNDEEIEEQLNRIASMKSVHEVWCEENGYDVDEFDQWAILEEVESDFNELRERISNQIFFSAREFSLSEELKEKLEQFT